MYFLIWYNFIKKRRMTFSNYNKNYLIKELQESLNKKDKEKFLA